MTLAVPAAEQVPLHRRLGLTDAELVAIEARLDRAPNDLELAIFSVMWSEHCSYKSSRPLLRTPARRAAPDVVAGPGENAGVVAIGDGLAVAFKIESHNHPSAVEPYQGAATGVGGILRDIFTMGARPIAVLDALRFGDPADARTRHLLRGVVAGVGGYGNCVGVPTVGGELVFDPSLRRQSAGQRDGHRAPAGRPPDPGRGARPGQPGDPVRLDHRPGRDRRGVGPGQRHVRRRRSIQATDRPGGRPVRREAPDRGLARADRGGPGRGPPGPGRRRDQLRHVRDGRPGRNRDPRRPRRDPAPRAGHGAVRGDDQRVPGADAGHRPARAGGRGPGGLRPLEPARRDDRAGDRRRRHRDRDRWPRPGRPAQPGRPGAGPHPGGRPDLERDRPRAGGAPAGPPPGGPGAGRRRSNPTTCCRSGAWTRARSCSACSAAPTWPAGASSSSSTTRPSRSTPWSGRATVRPSCACKGTKKALVATTDGNQAVGALDPWLGRGDERRRVRPGTCRSPAPGRWA